MRPAAALVLVLTVIGCGYSAGSLINSNYRSIYLPIWQTHERRRGLEVALAQALLQAVQTHTSLKVVGSRAAADTVLEGEILSLQERVLTENALDQVQEERVILTVNFVWKETATDKVIVRRRGFRVFADAALALGESELTANQRAFYRLAEKIVEELQAQW